MNTISKRTSFLSFLKHFLPVFLLALFPSIFHYANNVSILTINSLYRITLLNVIIGLIFYILCSFTIKYFGKAAIASIIFLLFYNIYGVIYDFLFKLDLFRVHHYNLLPAVILILFYIILIIVHIDGSIHKIFWQISSIVLIVLCTYNFLRIIPVELRKNRSKETIIQNNAIHENDTRNPDIYFIILDEFSGFEAIRTYWQYEEIDHFKNQLLKYGFFVAEESYAGSIDTLHQMAMRLNYKEYPLKGEYLNTYFHDIANNRVMEYLKEKGYTTIAFDQSRMSFAYPAKTPINSDILYEEDITKGGYSNYLFDDFGVLVSDNTMLYAFSQFYKINNPELRKHRDMINFTTKKLGDLKEYNPMFAYVHLLLPHMPFMFDADGRFVDPKYHHSWDHYLDQYIYSVTVVEKMLINIFSQYGINDQPVIILQSDHGARNKASSRIEDKILENYPEDYKRLILNAIYMQNCDSNFFTQNMDPNNTFPIVFNCIFNDNIPLVE